MRSAGILGMAAVVAGCTVSNPGYQSGDDAAVVPDQSSSRELGGRDLEGADRRRGDSKAKKDSKPLPDTRRWFDVKPFPDSTPWQCSKASDCDDKLACTLDTCNAQKQCVNTLQSGCLILGGCFDEGDANPLNPCELCVPGSKKTSWTTASAGAPCTGDGLSCTVDSCQGGVCRHELADYACLIGGVCFDGGDSNPQNSCLACSPADDQEDWSIKKDGTFCSGDGLGCTVDSCKAGVCTHEVGSKSCLVGGQCYYDGQAQLNNPCMECVAASSNTALTFVAGKACVPASQPGAIAGMCLKSKCAPWVETVFDPKVPGPNPVESSAFNAVDFVPSSGQVWAAGEYATQLGNGGVLHPLGPSAFPGLPVITANRFRGLKHRLAVGDAGIAMVHEAITGWVHEAKIEAYLASTYRVGVWGAPLANGTESFFLSGVQGASQTAMIACSISVDTTCVDHSGVKNGAQLGPVFGVLAPIGGLGGVWALPLASASDIYHNAGTGSSWSLAAPKGCEDLGNSTGSPCSQTFGSWRDLFASGPSDAWAVGSFGLLMRWDGAKWVRYTSALSSQSSYTFTAVYTSPADGLVTLAATSWGFNGRWVYLFNYNQALARWLGPIVIAQPGNNNNADEVRDLGGQGYGGLWAVGVRQVASTGIPRNQAWSIQLKP